ncbi:glycosyltransferase family A protein [Paenibacillus sacheonensis]|uniref:Uncharacterized protein n=1 Tax=Paenibacillus sacheonensis TaxID=742054 RepID=A0A7X4YW07_9BACL|nr:glycosyltransferase family A protein [Paenibacillus sacheonensis]MBM7566486.1 hypothetical protein [Paenibacillus sacheonensis]NBC73570.1 hypothetical protein [Paenibacillus sacheonensis]
MIAVLLCIVGCYVLAAAVIFILAAMRRGRERSAKHYVLLAGNEGQRMEWYMRSLHRFSHLTGTDVKVTVVDNGSKDDTLRIARVFAKRGMDVRVHAGGDVMFEGQNGSGQVEAGSADAGSSASAQNAVRAEEKAGRSGNWQRLRAIWRWRVGDGADNEARATGTWSDGLRQGGIEGADRGGIEGKDGEARVGDEAEPTHLLWVLQAEGIVSVKEQAVLIDLRNPADLSKLPF